MNRSNATHEISPTTVDMKCVARTKLQIGESPIWSAAESCLYFVDILEKQIYRYNDASQSLHSFPVPEMVTAVAPRRAGGLVASTKRGIAFVDPATGSFQRVWDLDREPQGNRFNDAKCDPEARFWAGTMSESESDAPAGHCIAWAQIRCPSQWSITYVAPTASVGVPTRKPSTSWRVLRTPSTHTTTTSRLEASVTVASSRFWILHPSFS